MEEMCIIYMQTLNFYLEKSAVFVYIIHVVTIYGIDAVANEIDVVLKFFDSGNENTRF